MAFKQWLSLKPFCLQMLWNWSRPELPLFCSPTSTSNASPSHCPGMCWLDLRCWLHSPLIGHWGPTWSRRSTTHYYFLEDQDWKMVFVHTGFLSGGPHSVSCGTCPLGKSRDVLTSSIVCGAWRAENTVECAWMDLLTNRNDSTRIVKAYSPEVVNSALGIPNLTLKAFWVF